LNNKVTKTQSRGFATETQRHRGEATFNIQLSNFSSITHHASAFKFGSD
jgi:hypothetical protein